LTDVTALPFFDGPHRAIVRLMAGRLDHEAAKSMGVVIDGDLASLTRFLAPPGSWPGPPGGPDSTGVGQVARTDAGHPRRRGGIES